MTSVSLKRAAADSNVILSAVIGKAALRIFTRPELEVVTTQFNLSEVEEYLPHLAGKYRLDVRALFWQFKMLPLRAFSVKYYKSHFGKAERFLKNTDPDDTHLLALALKENIPVWSNDTDFQRLSIPVYTTAEFLKALEG